MFILNLSELLGFKYRFTADVQKDYKYQTHPSILLRTDSKQRLLIRFTYPKSKS